MADNAKKRVTIAYTSGPTLTSLVHKLSAKEYSIQIYNPSEPALDLKRFHADMKFTKKDLDLRLTTSWNEVLTFNPDIILFLNLDVLPDISDEEFLKAIHSEMCKIKINFDESMVLFGQNYRGLLSASGLIKASKSYNNRASDRIRVISSINYAGQLAYPEKNLGTVLSMPAGNIFVFYDGDQGGPYSKVHKELEVLGGKWKTDDFVLLESEALVRAIVMYLETGNFDDINFVGRCPTDVEKQDMELADGLTWLKSNADEIHLQGALLKTTRRVAARVEEVSDTIGVDLSDNEQAQD